MMAPTVFAGTKSFSMVFLDPTEQWAEKLQAEDLGCSGISNEVEDVSDSMEKWVKGLVPRR